MANKDINPDDCIWCKKFIRLDSYTSRNNIINGIPATARTPMQEGVEDLYEYLCWTLGCMTYGHDKFGDGT